MGSCQMVERNKQGIKVPCGNPTRRRRDFCGRHLAEYMPHGCPFSRILHHPDDPRRAARVFCRLAPRHECEREYSELRRD